MLLSFSTSTVLGLDYRMSVLPTEDVARGATESFQNVGGEGVYDVLTFQKSRGLFKM